MLISIHVQPQLAAARAQTKIAYSYLTSWHNSTGAFGYKIKNRLRTIEAKNP